MSAVIEYKAPTTITAFEALVRQLELAEVRLTVLTNQLPLFGLTHMAEGCAREAAAIRKLLQAVRS